ncbi:hypothetical protein AAE478_000355 [Parahypoxylon ruwenzoriense]
MANHEDPQPSPADSSVSPEPTEGASVETTTPAEATTEAVVPGATEAPIEAGPELDDDAGDDDDDDDDDVDSALGDGDNLSSTASLTDSILQYRTLNGRTYHSSRHGADKYWGPNDEQQNEAMDMNHHFLTLCLGGKLFLTPLKNDIEKVLDIGTGTDEYPNCEIIGTDLSPIQPSWCPPNVKFEIDDAEQPWTYAPDSFDYIHIRYLLGGISDWPKLYRQAYAALKPGGWIESFEVEADYRSDDNTLKPDSAMYMWRDLFTEGGKKLGRPFTILSDDTQRKGIEAAGFVDITVKDMKVPMGGWPANRKLKEIGQWAQYTLEQDLEGFVMFMWNTVLERSLEEMQVFLAAYRKELRSRSIHVYLPQRVVYARKPENA